MYTDLTIPRLTRPLIPQNIIYNNNLFKIVYDAELGRREIPVGAGEVRVRIGYEIAYETHKFGLKRKKEVPVYITQIF